MRKISGPALAADMERRSGVALWRQIADQIRLGVASGNLGEDGRLPPETALSERFGVNRHTVRAAIAALVQEGVLRAEQGRGTFIEMRRKLSYPIAKRTRFSTGLEGQVRERKSTLLTHAIDPAGERVAEALGLATDAAVLRMETVSEVDGRPLSRGTSWFDTGRFPGFEKAYSKTKSITAALRQFGVDDYVRRSTIVSARHADPADLGDLGLAPGAIVLVTVAVNDDMQGRPIEFAETRFAADRVELSVMS